MPNNRTELKTVKSLIEDADLILETTPDLPQNRTATTRERLKAALAIVDDLLGQERLSAAAILGRKGGKAASRKLGSLPQNGTGAENAGRWKTTQE